MKKTATTVALVLVLAACGGGDAGDVTQTTVTGSPTTLTGASTTAPADGGDAMEGLTPTDADLVAVAIDDLAGRLAVDPGTITLVEFERVTWRDGSLGCPKPGMMYTQALVEGWRAVLQADGMAYSYHAGRDDVPFLCENPATKPSLGPGVTLTIPSDES